MPNRGDIKHKINYLRFLFRARKRQTRSGSGFSYYWFDSGPLDYPIGPLATLSSFQKKIAINI